jgi:hypothetical protein
MRVVHQMARKVAFPRDLMRVVHQTARMAAFARDLMHPVHRMAPTSAFPRDVMHPASDGTPGRLPARFDACGASSQQGIRGDAAPVEHQFWIGITAYTR